jgi:hypothetical protein
MVVFTDNSGVVWKCIAGRCLINADRYLKLANVKNQRTNKGMLFDIGYADNITPCLAVHEMPMPNGSKAG